jgi:branched-chain amino acid transport system permease protein
LFLQQLINGVTLGSVYGLIAVGYALVFSILEIINFAHGAVFMLGAFSGYFLFMAGVPLVPGLGLAMIITGFVGLMVERAAIRPLRARKAGRVSSLISTLGMGILLENTALLTFGSEIRAFPKPFKQAFVSLGSAHISTLEIAILALAVVLMIGLSLFVTRTKIGTALRACAQDMDVAELMGVNTNTIIGLTFFVGSALAAAAGVLIGMNYNLVQPAMGTMAGIKGFTASVLGGRGLISGAVVGGFVLGIAESLGAAYVHSGYRDAIAFGLLVIILIVKPTGLLGGRTR